MFVDNFHFNLLFDDDFSIMSMFFAVCCVLF